MFLGWSTRELRTILRGLDGLHIVSADIVEVAPAYDTNAELTTMAAADVSLVALFSFLLLPPSQQRREKKIDLIVGLVRGDQCDGKDTSRQSCQLILPIFFSFRKESSRLFLSIFFCLSPFLSPPPRCMFHPRSLCRRQ